MNEADLHSHSRNGLLSGQPNKHFLSGTTLTPFFYQNWFKHGHSIQVDIRKTSLEAFVKITENAAITFYWVTTQ
jgi:hypothetical protein